MIARWRERLARLFSHARSRSIDPELEAEFRSHLELAAADYERNGHSPADARRLAAARFGSRLAAREIVEDQRRFPSLDTLVADVRYALRTLRRTPVFTAAAIIVLGLGVGVNLAVFTVANATLFKGFRGIPAQDRLVYLATGRGGCCISFGDLLDWRAAKSFASIAAAADLRVAFDTGDGVETTTATEVTSNLFGTLGVQPILGRDFTADDDGTGATPVAILSHDTWRLRFRADPQTIGRVVRLNGVKTTIVGVMAPDFAFPQRQALWVPLGSRFKVASRSARGLWFGVARLADDATLETARSEMAGIGAQLAAAYPDTNAKSFPVVQTFSEFFVGRNAVATYGALWGGVGLLLLIACANLVNLLLARGVGRTREIAISAALGAGRGRIVRAQLLESMWLSFGGAFVGWALATGLLRIYAGLSVSPTQSWASQIIDLTIDGPVFLYLAGISMLIALLIGALPARRASALDIQTALRDGGRGSAGSRGAQRTSAALVAAQVAMSVVLMSAAALLARSFWNVSQQPLGYDPSPIVVSLASLPVSTYPTPADRLRFLDSLAESVTSIPGVGGVGFVDGMTGQIGGNVAVESDTQHPELSDAPQTIQRSISTGYFSTLGVRVTAGRDFDDAIDVSEATPTAIVNQRFATQRWPTSSAIGRRIRIVTATSPGPWLTVVGVAPDLLQDLSTGLVDPVVYRPLRQRPTAGAWVIVRALGSPTTLLAPLRRQIQLADPALPIWLGPFTLDQWHAGVHWQRGINGGLFMLFAGLALLLACIGLCAVLAATVAQRRQELSIRRAVGATGLDVAQLVMGRGLTTTMTGIALGLLATFATNRLLTTQLIGVEPGDPLTLATVVALIVVATVVGCVPPLIQATRVDPLAAMRGD